MGFDHSLSCCSEIWPEGWRDFSCLWTWLSQLAQQIKPGFHSLGKNIMRWGAFPALFDFSCRTLIPPYSQLSEGNWINRSIVVIKWSIRRSSPSRAWPSCRLDRHLKAKAAPALSEQTLFSAPRLWNCTLQSWIKYEHTSLRRPDSLGTVSNLWSLEWFRGISWKKGDVDVNQGIWT